MAIVFAALVPHLPLLVPSVGHDHAADLESTLTALRGTMADLVAARPDLIVVFSPHAPERIGSFSAQVAKRFLLSLKAFGDFREPKVWPADRLFVQELTERARHHAIPFALEEQAELDYGVSVPLEFLRDFPLQPPLVAFGSSSLDAPSHRRFGGVIAEAAARSSKRIAFLASGHLSELAFDDVGGDRLFWVEQYEERLLAALKKKSVSALLALDPEQVSAANSCAYGPLVLLMAALGAMTYKLRVVSHERQFSTHLAVMDFSFTGV